MTVPSYSTLNWRAAGTTSDAIELAGTTPVGFITPGTVASATVTFQMSDTKDGTYTTIKNSGGSNIQFTVAANGYYGFTYDQIGAMMGVRFLRIVGASSEAAGTAWKLAVREIG